MLSGNIYHCWTVMLKLIPHGECKIVYILGMERYQKSIVPPTRVAVRDANEMRNTCSKSVFCVNCWMFISTQFYGLLCSWKKKNKVKDIK